MQNHPAVESSPNRSWWSKSIGLAPFVGALLSIVGLVFSRGLSLATLLSPMVIIVAVQSLYTALQSLLWTRYRPFVLPRSSTPDWPTLTVIIPAFNEGPMVERSIRSAVKSDYPREKLEIIVVDDGSRDDTFFHMRYLQQEFPDLVRLMRFLGNKGKRAALEAGIRAARGELIVTIDSDSEVLPDTLREMTTPFLLNPRIGGVAGNVTVLNRDSFIAKMLEVQYALSFDFGRAAQSTYGAVFVCPGALSAFRRELLLPHLAEWTQQTFLGRPVNHGEDQALTNIVLRLGYETVYQRTAVIRTLAPATYQQMSRMFVRWDRSYIVEGLSFARFMFTRYRQSGRALPIIAFAVSNLRLLLLFMLPLVFFASGKELIEGSLALLVTASFTCLYYLRVEMSFRFVYGAIYALYSALLLQWVLPWALITVRDERWGTR